MVTKTRVKRKRKSRAQLVDEYMLRVAKGKSTKRIEEKLAKTKEGRRLKANKSRGS